ncbi:MAG: exodeoxyribonuclease VII small subunit [Lachnospiraceae bacterium]|nr:exodeoxyribonuclease VII small subunit [Lachnospiraceae bacterium]
MDDRKEMSIEEAFAALESLLKELGEGEFDLETSFGKYQEGLELVRLLTGRIDGIEKKLQILEEEAARHD